MKELGNILGVWAHPDDETYLSAGLMAACVRAGQRVTCVTATRGEGGSWDEERWPSETMGAVRDAELMRCLEILGVTDHRWLEYLDGACEKVDPEEATHKVQAILAETEPDTVLTFGPEGMTHHPDHQAVSDWTTTAFERSARPGARLLYATTTQAWADEFVPVLNRFNVFEHGGPPVTPEPELALDYDLPPDALEQKLDAINAHVSQVEGMMNAFGRDFFRKAHRAETFRLASTKS